MNELSTWLEDVFGFSPDIQGRIAASLLLMIVLWIIHRLFINFISRRTKQVSTRYRWQKASSYTVLVIGIVLVGRIWFEGFHSIATYLGLLTAGLAIALQELIVSLAGWVFILWRRPFQLGDRIQIGEHRGDVIDIEMFQFTLLEIGNWVDADQATGRIIHIPNGRVFSEAQANYGQAFQYIWNEIPVSITFESNWKRAKEILQQIVNTYAEHLSAAAEQRLPEVSRRFMIVNARLKPTVYTSVSENGVVLTMRYLCEPDQRRDKAQAIWEEVLEAFAAHADIEFAYPTQR